MLMIFVMVGLKVKGDTKDLKLVYLKMDLNPLTLLQNHHFWSTLWLKVDLLADLGAASYPPHTPGYGPGLVSVCRKQKRLLCGPKFSLKISVSLDFYNVPNMEVNKNNLLGG